MGDMRLQLQTANDEFLQVRHMSKKNLERGTGMVGFMTFCHF